jgi:hypothetical protein
VQLWREMLLDRRNSNRSDIETDENTQISKVGKDGKRKKLQYLINKRIIQNKTKEGGKS